MRVLAFVLPRPILTVMIGVGEAVDSFVHVAGLRRGQVRGIEKVNGRDVYLVVGIPQGDKPESLYFDTQTGLLLRKQTALPTPIGDSPYQVDFDDYRDTGSGVKVPFLIHMSPSTPRTELAPEATLRVSTVKDNAPIEDSKFVKPATKAAPSR